MFSGRSADKVTVLTHVQVSKEEHTDRQTAEAVSSVKSWEFTK